MLRKYGVEVCLELAERASVNAFKWSLPDLRTIHEQLEMYLDILKKG